MKKSMGLLNPLGVIGFFYVINQSLWKTYRRGKNSSSAALKKTTMSFHNGHGDLTMDMEVQWQPHHGNDKKRGWLISCHFLWGYATCCETYLVRCGRKSASVLWLLWDKWDALPQSSGIRSHNHPIISFGLYYCRIGNYVVDHGGPFPIARNTGMTERDHWHRWILEWS